MGCSGSKGPAKGDNSFELARNPPIPKGHIILRGFGNALEQEYVSKQENAVERWISRDLEMVGRGADKELAEIGSNRDAFVTWANQISTAVRKDKITVSTCKRLWQVDGPEPKKQSAPAEQAVEKPKVRATPQVPRAQPVQAAAPPLAAPTYVTAQLPIYQSYAQPQVVVQPQVVYQPPAPQVVIQQAPPPVIYQPQPQVIVQGGYGSYY